MTDGVRWHHRPEHVFVAGTMYIVTAGTVGKERFFHETPRLRLLESALFAVAEDYGWELQAWALLSNHYHIVAKSPDDGPNIRKLVQRLHSETSRELNRLDGTAGRQVWFQYWDTCLTYEKSYLARLNYVHQNAVKHGLVSEASQYPFCSAPWFESNADPAFRRKVKSFGSDRLKVEDDF